MTTLTTGRNEAIEIKLSDISSSPYQPRTHFDEAKLGELAESLKDKGVLQPVTVRSMEGAKPYELVLGERRLRAAGIAGLETIPCFVREYSDQEAREIALVENIQREDLTPVEEAHKIHLEYISDKLTVSPALLSAKIASIKNLQAEYPRRGGSL